MKPISEYIIESIVPRKTGMYLEPDKVSILRWLESKGFIKEKADKYIGNNENLNRENRPVYFTGPNSGPYTDWVSIHNDKIFELVIWFSDSGKIDEIELRDGVAYGVAHDKRIDFDKMVDILYEALE